MQIFLNLATRELRHSLTSSRQVSQLNFKRGDVETVEIFFVAGGEAGEIPAESTIIFCAKRPGEYDGEILVYEDAFPRIGSGASAKYVGTPSFNATPLDTALARDDDETNDLPYLDLMGEISWVDGITGNTTSSTTFAIRVHNDVLKGTEGTPLALPTPEAWLADQLANGGYDIGGVPAPITRTAAQGPPDNHATLLVNPDGADNSVLFTATAIGFNGETVTVEYLEPEEQAATEASTTDEAIIVTPGTKARMIITGALTSDGSTPWGPRTHQYSGTLNGKPKYSYNPADAFELETTRWTGTQWRVGGTFSWYSTEDVATPDLVTTWTPSGANTGTPTVTAGISSAAQVIAAVNANVSASALVTASAVGTVTGAVAAVAAANLSGATDPDAPAFLGQLCIVGSDSPDGNGSRLIYTSLDGTMWTLTGARDADGKSVMVSDDPNSPTNILVHTVDEFYAAQVTSLTPTQFLTA